jgi:hypothetical protein
MFASMKELTNSGSFTGNRIRISNFVSTTKSFGASIQPPLNHPFVILKVISQHSSKFCEFFTIMSGLWNNLQDAAKAF